MNHVGIIRRIDDLGRIVIPKEFRRPMGIKECDPLEIFLDSETGFIKIRKYAVNEHNANFAAMWEDLKKATSGDHLLHSLMKRIEDEQV